MKQIILHMIQYDHNNRVPIYALHCSLREFMQRMTNSTKLMILQQLEQNGNHQKMIKFDHKNYDWFSNDLYSKEFKYGKLKRQTQKDQTFFASDQKMDYNNSNTIIKKIKEIQKDQIILLKPNFILSIFDKRISNDESRQTLNLFLKNQKQIFPKNKKF